MKSDNSIKFDKHLGTKKERVGRKKISKINKRVYSVAKSML